MELMNTNALTTKWKSLNKVANSANLLANSEVSSAVKLNKCYKALLTRIVHTSLDGVIQSEASRGLLVPQLSINLLGQHLGHVVVVLDKVRILLIS